MLRAGRPGALSLDGPHVRGAGAGGRGRRASRCASRRPRRPGRRRHPVRRRHRRGRRGLPGRRGPGDRRHGLRHAQRAGGRRDRRPGQRATWPRPSGRWPAWSGWPPPSPGRPRSWWSPARATPAAFAAIDLVVQAEHGPDGLAWLVTWDAGAGRGGLRRGGPHRRGVAAGGPTWRRRSATAGSPAWSTAPSEALAVANAIAPEHLAADGARRRGAGAARSRPERRRRLHRALVAGQRGGLHRRAQPRAADQPDGALRRRRCGPTTSASTSTRCAVDARRRCATLGPHVVTLAETEGLPAHAESVRLRLAALGRGGAAVSAVPPVRPDLGAGRGLPLAPGRGGGAPQHQRVAASRRRTRWREELLAGAWPRCRSTATRTARPPSCAGPWPTCTGSRPSEVFCANGSNEVLQCLLLAYGGPGRRALLFEPTYALHSHIARITGTEVVEGARDDDFLIDRRRRRDARGRAAPDITFLCSPEQPDRAGRAARDRRRRAAQRRRAWSSSTRPTGSSRPSSALELAAGPGSRASS